MKAAPSTATNGFADDGSIQNDEEEEGDSPAALRDELRGLDPWEYVKASAAPSGISVRVGYVNLER